LLCIWILYVYKNDLETFFLDALLADLQSTIQQSNKLNGGINGGYGSINGVRSRLPSANSPVVPSPDQPPEYASIRTHKIERSTSNPAVQHELSVRAFVENININFCLCDIWEIWHDFRPNKSIQLLYKSEKNK